MSDDTARCLCGHLSTFHRRDHGRHQYLADCVRCSCPGFEDELEPAEVDDGELPFGKAPSDFV